MPAFFDSNILLYLAQDDERKAEIAERLLEEGGSINIQVLSELANVARRKFRYDWDQIYTLLDGVQRLLRVHDLTLQVHRYGLAIAERQVLSVYDGMIVAAALHADCDTLYSEDMHAGLVTDGRLTIVNPFA